MDSQKEPRVHVKKNKMMDYPEARLSRNSEVPQPLKKGGKGYSRSLFVSLLETRGESVTAVCQFSGGEITNSFSFWGHRTCSPFIRRKLLHKALSL